MNALAVAHQTTQAQTSPTQIATVLRCILHYTQQHAPYGKYNNVFMSVIVDAVLKV